MVGYGNQGRSWALNLRDSGCEPIICVRGDDTRDQGDSDGPAKDAGAASPWRWHRFHGPSDDGLALPLATPAAPRRRACDHRPCDLAAMETRP